MRPVTTLLLLPLALIPYQCASADELNYLCKVNGNYYDIVSKGKINETISVSIKTLPKVILVDIIGSEHTKKGLNAGTPGESKIFNGDPVISSSNYSSGETIDITQSMSFKLMNTTLKEDFALNKITGVISANFDIINDKGISNHRNYSGECKKK